ncbi:T9SS type A sorting domain-containing protein [Prevotella dentasini]|uniref:T9SS type A sorting domain-containing protein n=1 Tax=Prevotella dentasini TaxID=589537 RepID=UPI001F1D4706|nr:T9SS type A sorting domain-containing protein [Prevotella dentasini]
MAIFASPMRLQANTAIEVIEQEAQNIIISVSGSVLQVVGANDEVLQIYNVTGVRVMSVRVDGNDKRYNLNLPKGCYIVKVGKVVRKIYIR